MKRRVMFDEDINLRAAINIAKACAANVVNNKGHFAFEVILNSRKVFCIQPIGTHKMFKSHTLVATVPIPAHARPAPKRAKARAKTRSTDYSGYGATA
jgi:hypothetical protein